MAPESESWLPLDTARSKDLTDARLQLHHAIQLATAAGISYLPAASDDSHTNLEWVPDLRALLSARVPGPRPVRVGVRFADLTLLVADGNNAVTHTMPLDGRTIDDAATWLKGTLAIAGLDGARFTLKRHYEIPAHPVAMGAAFRVDPRAFGELAHWFGDANTILVEVTTSAGEVRCWPHHFDIATLLTVAPGKTTGIGLEPGDGSYAEPYFYVNLYPAPAASAIAGIPLAGQGLWHTADWIGAVLPGTRLSVQAAEQRTQAHEFIASAVAACRRVLLS